MIEIAATAPNVQSFFPAKRCLSYKPSSKRCLSFRPFRAAPLVRKETSEQSSFLPLGMFTFDRELAYTSGKGKNQRLIEIKVISICGKGKDLLVETIPDGRFLVRHNFLRRKWILR